MRPSANRSARLSRSSDRCGRSPLDPGLEIAALYSDAPEAQDRRHRRRSSAVAPAAPASHSPARRHPCVHRLGERDGEGNRAAIAPFTRGCVAGATTHRRASVPTGADGALRSCASRGPSTVRPPHERRSRALHHARDQERRRASLETKDFARPGENSNPGVEALAVESKRARCGSAA